MIFPYCHSHAPVMPYPGCIEISQLLCHSCPYPIYPSSLHLIIVLSNFIHLLVALGSSWACSGHGIHIQIVVTCLGWAFRVPGSQWLVQLQFGSSSQFLKFSHQWIRIHDYIDLKRMTAILFGFVLLIRRIFLGTSFRATMSCCGECLSGRGTQCEEQRSCGGYHWDMWGC